VEGYSKARNAPGTPLCSERSPYLNNKYFIDGRDPNSYANVAWLFGLHDRPWKEREIFGKVRYMSENGLQRKFDTGDYIDRIRKFQKDIEL
jgi:deoxyribodipyrimidine photo-lyase